MLFRAESERVHVNTGIRCASVMLERLDKIEVCAFTLGETVLTIKLELGGDNRVLTPAVHVESGLGKDERTGIGNS